MARSGAGKGGEQGLKRADALGEVVLTDHSGDDVRLSDLWQTGPVALVWLRHYG